MAVEDAPTIQAAREYPRKHGHVAILHLRALQLVSIDSSPIQPVHGGAAVLVSRPPDRFLDSGVEVTIGAVRVGDGSDGLGEPILDHLPRLVDLPPKLLRVEPAEGTM